MGYTIAVLPHPSNCDVLPQRVKMCYSRIANGFNGPRSEYMIWTCMSQQLLPLTNSTRVTISSRAIPYFLKTINQIVCIHQKSSKPLFFLCRGPQRKPFLSEIFPLQGKIKMYILISSLYIYILPEQHRLHTYSTYSSIVVNTQFIITSSQLDTSTLQLHYNTVHGKKSNITDRVIYMPPLFKIFNATSFTGFHMRKQMPHPLSFDMGHQSVYLVLWL